MVQTIFQSMFVNAIIVLILSPIIEIYINRPIDAIGWPELCTEVLTTTRPGNNLYNDALLYYMLKVTVASYLFE